MVSAVIALLIKIILTIEIAVLVNKNIERKSMAISIGYMWTYMIMLFLMLVFSLFGKLKLLIIFMPLIGLGLAVYNIRYKKKWIWRREYNLNFFISSLILILLCVFVLVHNYFYCDGTHDAMAYEIPRILIFEQNNSLFCNMNTGAKNIFVNEWNGELNALYYLLFSNTNRAIMFGNAEIFMFGNIMIYTFFSEVGIKSKSLKIVYTLLIMSSPVILFLAFTLKGDLFAILLFPLSLILFKKAWIKNRNEDILHLFLCFSLLGGSKVTMLPYVGISSIIFIIKILLDLNWNFKKLVLHYKIVFLFSILVIGVGCSRYFINLYQYGNMFERVEGESIKLSLINLKDTLSKFLLDWISFDNAITTADVPYALYKDFGLWGIIVLVMGGLIFVLHKNILLVSLKKNIIPVICYLFSFFFLTASTVYYDWSFRYYAPWGICLMLFILCIYSKTGIDSCCTYRYLTCGIATLCLANSLYLTLGNSDVTSGSISEASTRTEIEREYAFSYWLFDNPDGDKDINDFFDQIESNNNVLICNKPDTIISFLFGENNSNKVHFCSPKEIENIYQFYDVISISDEYMDDGLKQKLQEEYTLYTPVNSILKQCIFIR